jgi:hypothetical protein
VSLTIAAILAAARTPRASTPCPTCGTGAGAISREEAENRLQKLGYQPHVAARYRTRLVDARHAGAALETERDRRSHEAAIATLPEDRR